MPEYPITLSAKVDLPACQDDEARSEAARAHARIDDLPASAPAYDDTALVAALAELRDRPDDDEDEEARARIDALEARPTGGGPVGASAKTPFNSLGSDDTQRFTNLVAKMRAGWRGEVEFEVRNHNCPVQIPTLAGNRWTGTATPAGEFNTGTVITYTGPSGTSMFVLTKNTGYNYPANGVSRDFRVSGIQFNAGNDRDFLPRAPGGFDANYVQWYWTFHDCGWVGWRNVIKGWGTGLDLTGYTHLQGCSTTPLSLGGSECKWFLGGGLVDSNNAAWMGSDLPLIDWSASKSVIGSVMLSARRKSYHLKVTYGHNSRCIGTEFDSSDGDPTEGHQVRFDGTATNFILTACSFKGGQGILAKRGATEISVESCGFANNRGLARLEADFTGVLLWGVTNTYGNCPKVIHAARLSQVICADPRVTIMGLDGTTVLRAATA